MTGLKKRLMKCLAGMYGLFVPYKRVSRREDKAAVLRGYWLKKDFKQMGERVFFYRPGLLRGTQFISIGDDTGFEKDLFLTAWDFCEGDQRKQKFNPSIEIGSHCHFGAWNHITAIDRIVIGDGCLTGKWVTITDNSHGTPEHNDLQVRPIMRELSSKGPVMIGKNVWIGDKATILSGVTIGDRAIIAANAVVTKDVPADCIAAGVPAQIVRSMKTE